MTLAAFTETCRAVARWLADASLAAVCQQICGVRSLSGRPVLVKALFCAVDSKEGHTLAHVFAGGKAACPCRLCFVPFEECNYFGPGSWASAHLTDDAIAVAARPSIALEDTYAEASQHAGNPTLNNPDFFACPGAASVPFDLLHTVCDHSKVAVVWVYNLLRYRGRRGDTNSLEDLDDAVRGICPSNPVPSTWMRWRSLASTGLSDMSRGLAGCDVTDAFMDSRDRPSVALQVFLAFLVRPRLCTDSRDQGNGRSLDRAVAMSALWGVVGLHLDCHRRGWTNELRLDLRNSARTSAAHLTDLWARLQDVRHKEPKLLTKVKLHATLHFPESILRFGTALTSDVDKFEGNHAPFKKAWARVAHKHQREESVSSLSVLGKVTEETGLAWVAAEDTKERRANQLSKGVASSAPKPPFGVSVLLSNFVFARARVVDTRILESFLPCGSDARESLKGLLSSECCFDDNAAKGKVCLLPYVTLVWPDGSRATVHAAGHDRQWDANGDTDDDGRNDNGDDNRDDNGDDGHNGNGDNGAEGEDKARTRGRRSCVTVLGTDGAIQPFDVHLLLRVREEVFALGFYLAPIACSPSTAPAIIMGCELPFGWQEVVYERAIATVAGSRRRALAKLCVVPMAAIDGPACLIDLRRRGESATGRPPALAYQGLHIPRSFFVRDTSVALSRPCATWTALGEETPPPGELYRIFAEGACVGGKTTRDDAGDVDTEWESESDETGASFDGGDVGHAIALGGVSWASATQFLMVSVPRTARAQKLVGWNAQLSGTGFPWPATIIGCAATPRGQPETARLVAELANGKRLWAREFPGGLNSFNIPPRWVNATNAKVVGFFNYDDEGRTDVPVEGTVSFSRFRANRGPHDTAQSLQPTFAVRWDDGTTTIERGFDWIDAHAITSLQ